MIKRSIVFLLGIWILSLGVALIINSNLGTGAWDTIFVGAFDQFGLTVGTWIFIVQIVLMFINALINKSSPEWLALVTVFINGLAIDFWLLIVLPDFVPSSQMIQWICLLSGIVILAFGAALYLKAHFPKNQIDGLMIALNNRFGWGYGVSRTVGEVFALFVGFLLQGPIGIGTLIVTLTIGPLLQTFSKLLGKAKILK